LARIIGKKHSTQQLAKKNLGLALPNLNEDEKKIILENMWDNLGRIVGEFPHIAKMNPQELTEKYITISDESRANIDFIHGCC